MFFFNVQYIFNPKIQQQIGEDFNVHPKTPDNFFASFSSLDSVVLFASLTYIPSGFSMGFVEKMLPFFPSQLGGFRCRGSLGRLRPSWHAPKYLQEDQVKGKALHSRGRKWQVGSTEGISLKLKFFTHVDAARTPVFSTWDGAYRPWE